MQYRVRFNQIKMKNKFIKIISKEIIQFCLMSNFRRRLFMGRKEVKLYIEDLNLILTTSRGCQILDSSRKMFKVNVEGSFEENYIQFYSELSNILNIEN